MCVCVCVRACMYVCACVRAHVRACVSVCVGWGWGCVAVRLVGCSWSRGLHDGKKRKSLVNRVH